MVASVDRGRLFKKVASIIFMGGNVVLWCTGIINIHSGWSKVLGSSCMVSVNACYFFGNNRAKWNRAGHILSIIGMVFINYNGLRVFDAQACSGLLLYTLSRSLGIYSTLKTADETRSFAKAVLRGMPVLMPFLGIASRLAMMFSALGRQDYILAGVLFSWNIADIFLAIGPQHSPKEDLA